MLKLLPTIFFLLLSQQLCSQGKEKNIQINLKKIDENRVYHSNEVDVKAYFSNGESGWEKYLLSHSKYPKMPRKDKAIGRVFYHL